MGKKSAPKKKGKREGNRSSPGIASVKSSSASVDLMNLIQVAERTRTKPSPNIVSAGGDALIASLQKAEQDRSNVKVAASGNSDGLVFITSLPFSAPNGAEVAPSMHDESNPAIVIESEPYVPPTSTKPVSFHDYDNQAIEIESEPYEPPAVEKPAFKPDPDVTYIESEPYIPESPAQVVETTAEEVVFIDPDSKPKIANDNPGGSKFNLQTMALVVGVVAIGAIVFWKVRRN
mmetsp:Transcript_21223/g.42142  ORF Transcript_21223/g.42142 Transcript_21223/m.42142 type:complete len:233 (+) Transcript_21223:26-724(+)|eukprot:CAMPEP_0175149772 /NCGR_PEP_ID=MMETSP0087-20121206/17454_1 /TAXON_ID=136419 /ORGANISM="Unknown Unknown, Strain D1" /LENGTH=232 /DNA_ID=CAMNT_0016435551 /DNA_START=25 /DNA_END=723 /DNA_ORIENTATION=+